MGIKQQDLVPLGSYGPTALTPSGKGTQAKFFQVARADTANNIKVVLPASASIIEFYVYQSTASDAGTTAVVQIGTTGSATNYGTKSVITAATSGGVVSTVLPNLEPIPNTGDIQITGSYAETGTASTTGGPWVVKVEYVL